MTLTSLWQDGRTPAAPTPGEVTGHHDVVVVGAGLTGVTTALLLASAGRSVLVLEAHHVGAGTTGGSTAKVSCLQGTRLSTISRHHSQEVVRHYVAAQREGLEWVRRFCADHDVATQTRLASTYAVGPVGARRVEREHTVASAAGLPTRLVAGAALPFATTGAVELDDQLQLDPMALLTTMAAEATRRGAAVVEGVRVQRVRGSGPTAVHTTAGTVTTDVVVVATNLPMLDRGAHFARMVPARSYALAFRAGDALDLDGMYLSADGPSRSLRDAVVGDERFLMVGGEGHTTGRDSATDRRLDTLRQWTREHYGDLTETHAWSAQDFVPAHQLPLAGPVLPDSDHLLMAGGYAKWGMTNAVAAALALSSRVLGGRTDWADAMAGWSRRELSGLPRTALLNAEVGLELARGWLQPLTRVGRSPDEGRGVVRYDGVGTPVACARIDGEEHRASAVCTHLGGIVRWNAAERSWDCPLHGSRFAPDGTVLEGPATRPLRPR